MAFRGILEVKRRQLDRGRNGFCLEIVFQCHLGFALSWIPVNWYSRIQTASQTCDKNVFW